MALEIAYRPLSGLIPYARNARTHSDAQVAQTEIASGVMTINERRRHKNRPPVAHGDEALINTTNMPLARLFEAPQATPNAATDSGTPAAPKPNTR